VLIIFIVAIFTIKETNFDIYLLFILVFIGASVIIVSDHLLIIYLGLELQTFSLFILISSNKKSIKGAEAGLKYFILGALSSGLYLLGLVVFFINGISLNLKDLVFVLNDSLVFLGCVLILVSLSFKLTLVPFHFWIADIYEGSS
jgi:NADH:ubiquinone oxidoreductase subunit 2 (subunit N)